MEVLKLYYEYLLDLISILISVILSEQKMEISIRLTPLDPQIIKRLLEKEIFLVSHLASFTRSRLAHKLNLTGQQCDQVLDLIRPRRPHQLTCASDLMVSKFDYIRTTIDDLDYALGGGIRCGRLTEISGEAGSGKSNICSLLSLMAACPLYDGGHDGEVLLLHTQGEGKLKLAIKRFTQLCQALESKARLEQRLHVKDCFNVYEFMEMINRLPDLVSQKPNVKLIVLDSITCAFASCDDTLDQKFYLKRSIKFTKFAKMMYQLAWDRNIAIVITNHVSCDIDTGSNKPALGKLWSHLCQTKIMLEKKSHAGITKRLAHVLKGAINTSSKPAQFDITDGLPAGSFC